MSKKQHKGLFVREDVLDFALFMDGMMNVKAIERELDGSDYTHNLNNVLDKCDSQILKLFKASYAIRDTIYKSVDKEIVNLSEEEQLAQVIEM